MGKSIKEIKSLIEKELKDFVEENEIENLSVSIKIRKIEHQDNWGKRIERQTETKIKIN